MENMTELVAAESAKTFPENEIEKINENKRERSDDRRLNAISNNTAQRQTTS